MRGSADGTVPVSLYVHVPFCLSKCAYCDFLSTSPGVPGDGTARDPRNLFAERVLSSIEVFAAPVLRDVPTVYFGGGTPTVLGEGLARLVAGVLASVAASAEAEVTVETNPDTTDRASVAALVDAGVTRLSLGVQSFDDFVLRTLGRRHDAEKAARAAGILRESGAALSVDLICGVPGQSMASWRDTLRRAVETGAGHVSVYPLSVEPGTGLHRAIMSGALPEPDPDLAADMMLLAERVLGEAGLVRYETANHARPGEESRHNLCYWTGGEYMGVGPSAASALTVRSARSLRLPGASVASCLGEPGSPDGFEEDGRLRFVTDRTLAGFLHPDREGGGVHAEECEYLAPRVAGIEDVMLGLRLSRGVAEEDVSFAGLEAVAASLAEDGLVELSGQRWRTTERGWLLGNEVFGRVWAASENEGRKVSAGQRVDTVPRPAYHRFGARQARVLGSGHAERPA